MTTHTRRGFFARAAALVLGAAVEASVRWLPTTPRPRLQGLRDHLQVIATEEQVRSLFYGSPNPNPTPDE